MARSGRLAVFYIHHMNRVNSRNDLVVMMTALVLCTVVIITIIIIVSSQLLYLLIKLKQAGLILKD